MTVSAQLRESSVLLLFFLCRHLSTALTGDRVAIINVLQLPPSTFCSFLVNFESRYGMWTLDDFLPMDCSFNMIMTLPSVNRDLLMLLLSLPLSRDDSPFSSDVLSKAKDLVHSEPARSTKRSFKWFSNILPSSSLFRATRLIVKTQCDLYDCLFILFIFVSIIFFYF